jgi:hypothetical protein
MQKNLLTKSNPLSLFKKKYPTNEKNRTITVKGICEKPIAQTSYLMMKD